MTLAVGFVGLGRIGKPIAANILASCFYLMVFDVREEPIRELARLGAKRARGLRDLRDHSEIVSVAVVDDSQVEEVVASDGGLLQGGTPDSIIMIHSTIMPGTVHKLAQAGQEKKVKVIDAPVSGGEAGARERQLCYMVGGETEVFEKVRPVLAASAAHVFHMGALGSGAAAKMILRSQSASICWEPTRLRSLLTNAAWILKSCKKFSASVLSKVSSSITGSRDSSGLTIL